MGSATQLVDRHTGLYVGKAERVSLLEVATEYCVDGYEGAVVVKRGVQTYTQAQCLNNSLAVTAVYIYVVVAAFGIRKVHCCAGFYTKGERLGRGVYLLYHHSVVGSGVGAWQSAGCVLL